ALRERGVGAVLVTLGGAGAVLVDDDETWFANAPAVRVRSTVGAGDSALAGYLLAGARGLPPRDRLAWAVGHGSVAASLPGTGLPLGLDPATFRATLRRLD
ncbi:PfkB family carbohydrate kinase, partial [Dietzia cinnamea]